MTTTITSVLDSLNPKQQDAATSPARITKIEAGAGTGKTKTLIGRIEFLMEDNRDKIIFVAFTNAVVDELNERISKHINDADRKLVEVKTCSSLGYRLINTHFRELGFSEKPKLVKDWELVDGYIDQMKSNDMAVPEGNQLKSCLALEAFATACRSEITDEFVQRHSVVLSGRPQRRGKRVSSSGPAWTGDRVQNQLKRLQAYRKQANQILFQDMISLPLELDEDAFRIFNAGHVLVDEVQDLNYAQHEIIRRLSRHAYTLTMVGDSAQAIYGFQGSQPEVFDNIATLYPKVAVKQLDVNYRSTQTILDFANQILKEELGYSLELKAHDGRYGPGLQFYDNQDEAVVNWINMLMADQRDVEDKDYSEIAILYRARRHAASLEMALSRADIPYVIDGQSFFDEPVVQDILSYFRFFSEKPFLTRYDDAWTKIIRHKKYLGNKTRDEARDAARLTQQGIFEVWHNHNGYPSACRTSGQKKLWHDLMMDLEEAELAYRTGNWVALARLGYVLAEPSWEDRFSSDVYQMKEAIDRANGFIDWVRSVSEKGENPLELLSQHEEKSKKKQDAKTRHGVRLMTVHGSKGLEWDHVGIWNVGPTTFPLGHEEPMEERRLCYVAITRGRTNVGVFVNPEASRTTINYETEEVAQGSWADHPILRFAGTEAEDLMRAVRGE